MAFMRNKRAKRIGAGVVVLWLSATAAAALSPVPPCDGVESNMGVYSANIFGFGDSGFLIEDYMETTVNVGPDANGNYSSSVVTPPVPQLAGFNGYRITDCRSGEFLAIGASRYENPEERLTATEFLREKVQDQRAFSLSDVRNAAQAIYRGQDILMITLRETDGTCACDQFYGD